MKKSFFKITILAFAISVISKASQAQDYKTGVGIRFGGYENGITVKHFMGSTTAIEGILGFRTGGFVLTGLYQKHANAFDIPSLKWFYGFGAHIGGIEKGKSYKRLGEDRVYNNSAILFGADAILGLEWLIPELPITIGADLHPRLELLNGTFIDIEPALTIRYTF